jgi:nucleotide-binding universal stress UspA family protein
MGAPRINQPFTIIGATCQPGNHLDGGPAMSTEMLTYNAMAERLNCSAEAARSLAKRLHLPRKRANDGKALVVVDLTEIQHKAMPARSSAGHRPDTAALKAKIEMLQAELAELETMAAGHRADYERERDRGDRIMAELLTATAALMAAKEATARLEGEFAAWQARPWWRRLAG